MCALGEILPAYSSKIHYLFNFLATSIQVCDMSMFLFFKCWQEIKYVGEIIILNNCHTCKYTSWKFHYVKVMGEISPAVSYVHGEMFLFKGIGRKFHSKVWYRLIMRFLEEPRTRQLCVTYHCCLLPWRSWWEFVWLCIHAVSSYHWGATDTVQWPVPVSLARKEKKQKFYTTGWLIQQAVMTCALLLSVNHV